MRLRPRKVSAAIYVRYVFFEPLIVTGCRASVAHRIASSSRKKTVWSCGQMAEWAKQRTAFPSPAKPGCGMSSWEKPELQNQSLSLAGQSGSSLNFDSHSHLPGQLADTACPTKSRAQ